GRHLRPYRRPGARAPDDHRVRQHPPSGRAGRAPARGAPGRGLRGRAPRQHGAADAARGRGAPQGGRGAGGGRDRLARAGHRGGRRRPRLPRGRADFDAVLDMLADGVATRRGRRGALLHLDRVHGRVRARRGARLAAITSGGAIPDNADYEVVEEPQGLKVGTVNEDFAVESMAGDIFLLGNRSWRIRRVEAGRVRVEDAAGAPPTIPFWLGEAPARTRELSAAVSALRAAVAARLPDTSWLVEECGLSADAAAQLGAYVGATEAALGTVPTTDCVVAERFFDEAGGMQLVVHAPFGGRINRAWGLALRKRFCV